MAGEGADWTAFCGGAPQEVGHVWWFNLARVQVLLTLSHRAPKKSALRLEKLPTATMVGDWLTGPADARQPS